MGTDQIALFNKDRCDRILSLEGPALDEFVSPLPWSYDRSSPLQRGFAESSSIAERIAKLRSRGILEETLKMMLVEHFCLSPERISLDYWACYSVVFKHDPPGSIPDLELFPGREEQHFLLLNGEHVSQMMASLELLRKKLTVMSDTSVLVLRYWQELCVRDPNYMVAYFFSR